MVELKGSLSGIGLPAILQLIGELHHSGTLELSKGDLAGMLGFDDGRLVTASFEEDNGSTALEECVRELVNAEFRFVEGAAVGERTLDLRGQELQQVLVRIASGEPVPAGRPSSLAHDSNAEPSVCPRLGFADDPARHYSRPTAMHRCYATELSSLVTAQEQRDLCLGGRYPTCPRFRNERRPNGHDTLPTPVGESAAGATTRSVPMPAALPASPAPTPTTESPQWVSTAPMQRQPGVAEPVPPSVPAGVAAPALEPPATVARPPRGRSSTRGLILLGGVAALGLFLAAMALSAARPSASTGPLQDPAKGANGQAVEAVPSVARQPAATPLVIAPSPIASAAATPATVARAAASPAAAVAAAPVVPAAASPVALAAASPTSGAAAAGAVAGARSDPSPAGPPLIDVRFASGIDHDWVDNAPYGAWSDGAYRLQARQPARFVAIAAPLADPPADVVVSATFRKTGGPPGGGYGLIVRDQGPPPRDGVNQTFNAYVLEIGDLGEFGVWRRAGDHWIDLVPWTRSSVVRTGGSPNELVVRALGDHLVFTVNGVVLANAQDDSLPSGGVGVFVGGDYNQVALDRFAVQAPD